MCQNGLGRILLWNVLVACLIAGREYAVSWLAGHGHAYARSAVA